MSPAGEDSIHKSRFCYQEKRLTAMHCHDTMMKIYERKDDSSCQNIEGIFRS